MGERGSVVSGGTPLPQPMAKEIACREFTRLLPPLNI
jgi:hypothetical protein